MADATDAASSLSASVAALAGARTRVECASGSRTQQLTRKRPYKTMDLQRHKSSLAMTPLGRPFFADNPKRGSACRYHFRRTPKNPRGVVGTRVSESGRDCGHRAGNVVATTRDAYGYSPCPDGRPHAAGADVKAASPRAVFARGDGRGVRPFYAGLLNLTVFKINRNRVDR
jgi:hypothetical protein